jgi:cytochrome c biogenesis protein CcdA
MVETITPVVHGTRRKYLSAVLLHTLGATISAGLLGVLLGGMGAALGLEWNAAGVAVIAIVGAIYAGREAFGWPVPLPQMRQQVPEWWRTFFSPRTAAALYGLGLGAGFFTYLSFGTFAAVAAAALTSGDPLVGAALCAPFGAARGLAVAVSANPVSIDRLEAAASTRLPRAANAVALVGLTGISAAALLMF